MERIRLSLVADLRTSDHLANERTFLAWLRTSISLTSLGFVVSRFSVWLRELSARIDQQPQSVHTGWSLWIGVAMMLAGAFLAILSARRYRVVKLAIEEGRPSADTFAIFLVTGLVILLSAALIIYMLLTSGK